MTNGAGAAGSPPRTRTKRASAPTTPLARTRRARRIATVLAVEFPEAPCELDFSTPLELTVATVLAAQSTDVRINLVTPTLFARYPDAAAYAGADRVELEEIIRSTGFYRNKATAVMNLAAAVVDRFAGQIPRTLDELVTLPGIGRKTANVVLGNAFGLPGITVDTHVGRLMQRWGLTDVSDPVKIERDLTQQLPPAQWTDFSNRAIYHGRRICHAKKPACGVCRLAPLCPAYGIGPTEVGAAAALVTGAEREHLLALAEVAAEGAG